MSLRSEAADLVNVLRLVVRGLREYNADDRSSYTRSLAQRLGPLVDEFDRAVTTERSRESAYAVLSSIKLAMEEINGAATKGEIPFVADNVLARYRQLNTIFQELRHRGQSL